jgi:hypothetical protein
MAQPNVPASKTGQFPPAKLVSGGRAMQGDHTLATIDSQAKGESLRLTRHPTMDVTGLCRMKLSFEIRARLW